MKNKMQLVVRKMFLMLLICLIGSFAFGAPFEVQGTDELFQKIQQRIAEEQRARELGIASVETEWTRCDIRQRKQGHHFVSYATKCKTITTNCGAIIKDEKVFISSFCYNLKLKYNQRAEANFSVLKDLTGQRIYLSERRRETIKDFIMWDFQKLPPEFFSKPEKGRSTAE